MKTLVIGAARSGLSITRLLLKHHHDITLLDVHPFAEASALQAQGVRVFVGPHPLELLEEAFDLIVKNPGIPDHNPYVQAWITAGYTVVNEIEVAQRFAPHHRIAAITGTNGKTTCTELLGHILEAHQGLNSASGNNGRPYSELVVTHGDQALDVALEMAAFQLLNTQHFKPKFATILNLSPDHLDVFEDVDSYYRSKTRIYLNQDQDDTFFLNIDDEHVLRMCDNIPSKIVRFSLTQASDLCVKGDWVYLHSSALFTLSDVKLPGQHNLQNAMVSAAMAFMMGVKPDLIQAQMRSFMGVEHRIEFVAQLHGVDVFNDSKATTVESTLVALNSFSQPVVLLVGGYDKHTGFDVLTPALKTCKAVFAYGQTKQQFKDLLPSTHLCDTLFDATELALKKCEAGDVLLLSPACASYDQFKDFEDRGHRFKAYIQAKL